MLDTLIVGIGFWVGVCVGFVSGVLFALYALPPLVHVMAGRLRDRE